MSVTTNLGIVTAYGYYLAGGGTLTLEEFEQSLVESASYAPATLVKPTISGTVASFPDGAEGVPVKDLKASIVCVQSGTGDPSPQNIRPITGWTGANVVRAGKNLLPKTLVSGTHNYCTYTLNADGTVTVTGTANGLSVRNIYNGVTPIAAGLKNGTYIMTGCPAGGSSTTYGLRMTITKSSSTSYTDYGSGTTFTIDDDVVSVRVYLFVNSGQTVNITYKPMIRLASVTDATYEPYQGTAYPVTWQSDAGTVYGGTVDVTTGVLTVDMETKDLSTLTWNYQSSTGLFYSSAINSCKTGTTSMLFSKFAWTPLTTQTAVKNSSVSAICKDSNGRLYVKDTSYADITAFNTDISGAQMVYELATPLTYTLTPTQIATLLGTNNVWADTGDVTVEYVANTKLYIDNALSTTEDDYTANNNITNGSYFFVGNKLFKATQAIANGTAIVPGTNCTETNIADALNALQ